MQFRVFHEIAFFNDINRFFVEQTLKGVKDDDCFGRPSYYVFNKRKYSLFYFNIGGIIIIEWIPFSNSHPILK